MANQQNNNPLGNNQNPQQVPNPMTNGSGSSFNNSGSSFNNSEAPSIIREALSITPGKTRVRSSRNNQCRILDSRNPAADVRA